MTKENILKRPALTGIILASLLLIICFVLSVTVSDASEETAITDPNSRTVPIIMYHSILPDPERAGEYVLPPSSLESDMLWLKEHGYRTVTAAQLADFCEGSGELPEKPVILSFDDGQLNNLTYVMPLLQKHDMCASFSIVGRYCEAACEEAEPSDLYSYMDISDLITLTQSGRAELLNHSYDMHELSERRGALQKSTESFEEYRRIFFNDTFAAQRLIKENCGFAPVCYAYPYGFSCAASRALVKICGFKCSFGVEEKLNTVTKGDKNSLYDLGRFNRPAGKSSDLFFSEVFGQNY